MTYSALIVFLSVLSGDKIPDGSLLFVEGGSKIVMKRTNSPYSHVGVLYNIKGKVWFYEAVKPVVRKIKLSDYIKEIELENDKKEKTMKLWVRTPKKKINTKAMFSYLEKQLGRKYSIKSYIAKKPRSGIHCGELTARALLAGEIKVHGNLCRKSPQSIMDLCNSYYKKQMML